ncbi:dihydrodipicolinate synthase family protein [Ornithinimicrobium murale]|uniref:dihydrodipicolinate synthase family protein n=1 Tax=Ornithinimicrobium murale TaxID=1050153 RepID=UPI000E0DC2B9|nr:dihydrodipicolinate synthase family protein [Ornithinimicrobium murale]
MSELIRGLIPVAPTVFLPSEELDLPGQRRVVDFVVDSGSAGICVLANYSEQFSITDDERRQITEATVDQAAGRIEVMVTTSHYSARVAAQRSREAQDMGASMVMLMPPFFGKTISATPTDVADFFRRVADEVDIPIMLQDAPMSATPMSVDQIAQLAREIPHFKYAKMETARAAEKIRALQAAAGDDMPGLYDGEEGVTLIPDLDAGAVGSMSSCLVPDLLSAVVRDYLKGDREAASKRWEEVLPLIHFENRHCHLLAAKVLLEEGGVISNATARAPFGRLDAETRRALIELARRRDPLVLRWAA